MEISLHGKEIISMKLGFRLKWSMQQGLEFNGQKRQGKATDDDSNVCYLFSYPIHHDPHTSPRETGVWIMQHVMEKSSNEKKEVKARHTKGPLCGSFLA